RGTSVERRAQRLLQRDRGTAGDGTTAEVKENDNGEEDGTHYHREQGEGDPQEVGLQHRRRRPGRPERLGVLAAGPGREAREGERPQDRPRARLHQHVVDAARLRAFLLERGQPTYRADQVLKAVYQDGVSAYS